MALDDPETQIFTSSVFNEVAFGPENLLLPPEEIKQRVKRALEIVGLAGFEERAPSTLSGGEKPRLIIAAALAQAEKILVMDEPIARLDPAGAEEIFSVIKSIREKHRLTVVMATHSSEHALKFADRVFILRNGTVAACGTPQDIFRDAALLEENGIRPPVTGNAAGCKTASLPAQRTAHGLINNLTPPAVKITNLSYSYNSVITPIKNFNLTIENNDFAAIAGQNGCGKTTLLKIIAGLLRQDKGEIHIRGKNSKDLPVSAISKEIGFVMQNPDCQLFSDTVYREVSFALKNLKLPESEIRDRTESALSAVGLKDKRGAFPLALSRGERAKTVIASVLAMGCKIIILDEPDAALDYRGCRSIMDTAGELNTNGYTIIFVSHNMPLISEYAKRLIVMNGKSC
jgi:energy-coupling factor transport system ATP-binding protein